MGYLKGPLVLRGHGGLRPEGLGRLQGEVGVPEEDPAQTLVRDIMTRGCTAVSPRDDCREATRLMSVQQVRRLPVVEDGRLVGIVSLADLARSQRFDMEAAQALGEISENIIRRRF